MTIAATRFATPNPGRWVETPRLRPTEQARQSQTMEPPATNGAERDGPHRSPLFRAIKEALDAVVAQANAPASADAAPTEEPAAVAVDGDKLEHALVEFARALMHALREGGELHGGNRGRHLGHAHAPAHGYHRHAWGDASQRVAQLAQGVAPEAATQPAAEAPATAPDPAPTEAAEPVASADASTPVSPAAEAAKAPGSSIGIVVRLTLELSVPESPWKATHDGLIEAFAEVQRSLGRPADESGKSLEEQLREMLLAMAAKLQSNKLQTLALAPAGALLSVAA
jgi:hypothetical protein